jgi:O-antigen ligase
VPQAASRTAVPLLPLALAAAAGVALVAVAEPRTALLAVAAVIIFLITFLNTEIAIHLIILSMLLSPEAFIGGGGVEVGKLARKGMQAVFRFEDFLLVVVGLSWFARTALRKELGLLLRTPLNLPIAAYAVATALATALGVLHGNVGPKPGFFYALKYFEYFVLYFVMVNTLRDERQLRRYLFTGFATCAIASIIGILNIPSGQRISAPFEGKEGEPNTFGGYLVFMLALALALWLQSRTAPAFFGWLGISILISLPLLFTLSRASWLAAIPMGLTLLALTERKLWIALPLVIAVVAAPLVFPKAVQERFAYTYSAPPEPDQVRIGKTRLDSSTSARIESWRLGLEGWTRRPLLGYGVTGFPFMDAQFVRTLTETGLVGLGTFLWLVAAIFRTAWQTFRTMTDPFYRSLAMGYLAGLVALLVHGIGANTFIIVRIMEPFWFFTAIIVLLPTLVTARPPSSAPAAAPTLPRTPAGRPLLRPR